MNTNEYSLNNISGAIVDCSIRVHKELGPGLLESVYEVCLMKELLAEGLTVRRQVALPVFYKSEILGLILELICWLKRK